MREIVVWYFGHCGDQKSANDTLITTTTTEHIGEHYIWMISFWFLLEEKNASGPC